MRLLAVAGIVAAGCADLPVAEDPGGCAAGEFRCADDDPAAFERCADGAAWEPSGTCDGECDAAAGRCAGETCDAGSRCADDGRIEVCEPDVGGWLQPAACADGYTCDPDIGSDCAPVICAPGARACDGESAVECNARGTAAALVEPCDGDGLVCRDGACFALCDLAADDHAVAGCLAFGVDLDQRDGTTGGKFGGGSPEDSNNFSLSFVNPHESRVATVTVDRAAGGEWAVEGTTSVPAQGMATLTFGDTHVEGSGLASGAAYRIRGDIPVYSFQFNSTIAGGKMSFSSGASALLSKASLLPCGGATTRYYTVSLPANEYGTAGLTIVGTEGATGVIVRSTASIDAGPGVEAFSAGGSAGFTIDEGDVLALSTSAGDPTGTFVESDRPVAVFSHHEDGLAGTCGDLGGLCESGYGPDGFEEQMLPVSSWGKRFVALGAREGASVPYPAHETIWRIVAAEDDTIVEFEPGPLTSGLPAGPLALGAGEFADLHPSASGDAQPSLLCESNRPVFLAAFESYLSVAYEGDPALVTVIPVEQWPRRFAFRTWLGLQEQARMVVPPGASVTLGGEPPVGFEEIWGDYTIVTVQDPPTYWPPTDTLPEATFVEVSCDDPDADLCGVGIQVLGGIKGNLYGFAPSERIACVSAPVE